ncbi:MAG TPA: ABC transporter ATP-binding protein [Ktedonobacterales bacterium]|nr:ABC transporter ATP-binding protein [Ktedonobacterales bacterium]
MSRSEETTLEHATIQRVLRVLRPYTSRILVVLVLLGISSALGVGPAFLSSLIIDHGILDHSAALLLTYSLLWLVVMLSISLINVLTNYLTTYIGLHLMADLREQLYNHVLLLPMRYFSTGKLGDLMSRFENDVGGIQYVLNTTIISFVTNVIVLISTTIFMLVFNWFLTLVVLASVSIYALPTFIVGKRGKRISKELQQQRAAFATNLEETLNISAMLLIKNFGRQRAETQKFTRTSQKLTELSLHITQNGRWLFMCIGLTASLGAVLIYLIGGLKVIGTIPGPVTLGQIVAFIALLGRVNGPAGSISNTWVGMQQVAAQLDRIFAVLDQKPEIQDAPGALALNHIKGHIVFKSVDFAYNEYLTLHDINLEIHPGQTIAVVGPSGSGKTTLSYLIARIYDVNTGGVSIDGYDVRTITMKSLSAQIGIVTQETYLFHDTVRQNIAYGCPSASIEEIIAAARAAYIHEVIVRLPDGYETLVGERGYTLSGGEKQRIAIARVILKNPRILILDEATSSLDSCAESIIQAALEPLMHQRTTLVIAHRLSTIVTADLIVVMDQGQIIERGTHQQLLARDGLYAKMYHNQFTMRTA